MSVPFSDITATLSPEKQEELKAKVAERVKAYRSLLEFRKELGLTQEVIAERMLITQESVSRLERRKDMHISTLKRYVEALGGQLEIHVRFDASKDLDYFDKKLEIAG